MQIRFLRPELAQLHNNVAAAMAMMGAEVSPEPFLYEVDYAVSGRDLFDMEGPYLDVLLAYLSEHAPPPATVLDVGAGTGRIAIPLAQAGYQVALLEPAASGLRIAEEKAQAAGVAHQLSYVCGYAADAAAFRENSFDVVLGIQSLAYEADLKSTLAALLQASRKVLCFDVYSRYGFLAGRMSGGYEYTAGYNPRTILYVLDEHRTPGEKTHNGPDPLPLYTSDEIAQLAREAGMEVDRVIPGLYHDVFEWEGGYDPAQVAELERIMSGDRVLKELSACHLVLGRKPAERRQPTPDQADSGRP